ncbi:DNA recombination protein RmuC [Nitrospirillum amazonense]|uniref:DNA recombination protein RmuC homolog n=1 Tax=Nitrospirillum amazonense TaxID=28077 RepID=A0A560JPP8_9PROT|nr:DNA recombination protein RmuC [Nitrospirillum amazonense]TWB73118.1 DNA recombination protein RmuC [Nitrospirillum amazonense]
MSLDLASLALGFVAALVVALVAARVAGAGARAAQAERLAMLEADLADLRAAKAEADRRLAVEGERASRVPLLERDLATVREEGARLSQALAASKEALARELRQAEEKMALLIQARETMAKEFKVLADEVMTRHGETFAKQNRTQLDGLLAPLRDRMVEFQQGLQLAHTESAKDRAALAQQIRQLTDTSARMTSETHNLTQALKGKAQTQGAWGEMILSTILERSGLREGEEYVTQESRTDADGSRLRPDVVVNLPGGQRVVIDAKVSLTAFEAHVNAEDEVARMAALARHVVSLRTHIKTLGSKDYTGAVGSGLDYVLMFVPIEGALAVAVQEDPALTAYAADMNVAIATPTTLMVALRTVANVWQVERRNRNAEAIADRAGKLYDKFVGFLEDMRSLGTQLDRVQKSYSGAMTKLSTGTGNLVRQVEQLKDMGAKTSKAIPVDLREDGLEDKAAALETVGTLSLT